MLKTTPYVAIYARASVDRSELRISVDRQKARCEERAADLFPDMPVRIFEDNDRKASDPDVVRPKYEELLGAIRRGEVAEIVVHEQSRLTRQTAQWDELVVVLTRAGITKVHTVQQGTIGVEPGNRLTGRLMAVIDAEEVERLRARVLATHKQLADEGRPGGARSYYGYRSTRGDNGAGRPELAVVPEQAAVIRRIADELLAGHSATAVATRLNADGVRPPREWYTVTRAGKGGGWIVKDRLTRQSAKGERTFGNRDEARVRAVQLNAEHQGRWTYQSVLTIARNPRIAGQRVHWGKVVGPAKWEAIIAPERFEALSRVIGGATSVLDANGRARVRPRGTRGRWARRWLLTGGLARCGLCKMPLVAGPTATGVNGYLCSPRSGHPEACSKVSLKPAEVFEDLVVDAVRVALADPGMAARLVSDNDDPERQVLADEMAAADARIARAAELFGAGEIDEETWRTMHGPAAARADVARERLRTLAPSEIELPPAQAVREGWGQLPLATRKAVLARVLNAVYVLPSDGRLPRDPIERVSRRLKWDWRA